MHFQDCLTSDCILRCPRCTETRRFPWCILDLRWTDEEGLRHPSLNEDQKSKLKTRRRGKKKCGLNEMPPDTCISRDRHQHSPPPLHNPRYRSRMMLSSCQRKEPIAATHPASAKGHRRKENQDSRGLFLLQGCLFEKRATLMSLFCEPSRASKDIYRVLLHS